MKNADRIIRSIREKGAKNILIHAIPGTMNWIVCQKIEADKWLLTLCEPMKNVTYNLGIISNEDHLRLWYQLASREIELKAQTIATSKLATELRKVVKNFIKITKRYAKFLKQGQDKAHTKEAHKIHRRTKTSNKQREP